MKTSNFSVVWKALALLVVVIVAFAGVSGSTAGEVEDAVASAVSYLQNQSSSATNDMALVAAGQAVDVSYLQSFSGESAIAYAKPIMALVAAGKSPHTFPQENFVEKLKSFYDGLQLGEASQVNDDIWGILALRAAGLPASDTVIQASKNVLLANQNTDGGWAWNVGGSSDTNDTAAAIIALLEAGVAASDSAIQNAVVYLQAAQNEDGGFPYDPLSEFGTDSDSSSDAWVIAAINKLGQDATMWASSAGNTPINHLLSLQDTDGLTGQGGFWWMPPPADFNNKASTADAVVALLGRSFPVVTAPGAFVRVVGSGGELCNMSVGGVTAMDTVLNVADACGYTYDVQDTSFGPYLAGINNDTAEGTAGWMYTVNGNMPQVGAAEYALTGGENVLWYFGEFDADPPAQGDVSQAVDVTVDIIDGQGDSDGGGGTIPPTPEAGFSVNSPSLAFGQVIPGQQVSGQVSLKNEGEKNIQVEAEVQGDSVFGFLTLDNVLWNAFEKILQSGTETQVNVGLSVPNGFSDFGQKQGRVIFWGTVQD